MRKNNLLIVVLFFLNTVAVNAQYSKLLDFAGSSNGATPYAGLVISGGVMYGTTSGGGANGGGCIFSINTNGSNYKDMEDFNTLNGLDPRGTLIFSATKDSLFGMTVSGGTHGDGCIFSIKTDGTGFAVLYSFTGATGQSPEGDIDLSVSGDTLFGVTSAGGANGDGVIFAFTLKTSAYTLLYSFSGSTFSGPFSIARSGNTLFGLASFGGFFSDGGVFSIHTNGADYFDLWDFDGPDGSYPFSGLLASGEALYGATTGGGASGDGRVFSLDTDGTNYQDLIDFTFFNGGSPACKLLLSANILYGLTESGGPHDSGCIFSVQTDGSAFQNIYGFTKSSGFQPHGSLTASGNTLYGMTQQGGANDEGTIFSYIVPTLGINDITNKEAVSVYPDPSSGIFNIRLKNQALETGNIIEVYTITGVKIYTTTLEAENTRIDLRSDADGIYIYRVLTQTGSLILAGKLDIQK